MKTFWYRYRPFVRAGIQEMITYRVNFFLYRLGDVIGAFVAFYLWKAVFDSSANPVLHDFTLSDMTFYIIIGFLTNLLTKSDTSFMIGDEVKDGSIVMRLLRPVHFAMSYLFTELGFKVMVFLSVGLPFLLGVGILQIYQGQSVFQVLAHLLVYLISLIMAYLMNFYFNICFGFTAFVFKNLWGSNLLKNSVVAFLSGSLIPLAFFPSLVSKILSFLPFSSLVYAPVMMFIGKYNAHETLGALGLQLFWLVFFIGLSQLVWRAVQGHLTVQGG